MVSLPNLIETQTVAYDWFLKDGCANFLTSESDQRFHGKDLELSFGDYYLDEPKYDEKTSKKKTSLTKRPSLGGEASQTRTGEIKDQEFISCTFPLWPTGNFCDQRRGKSRGEPVDP